MKRIKTVKASQKEFVINKYLSVRLEAEKVVICVGGQPFDEFLYVFTTAFREKFLKLKSPYDTLNFDNNAPENHKIINEPPLEQEFEEYCSVLQVWAENGYEPHLNHRYLSFPLLEALYNAGDPVAVAVFKEKVKEKFKSGYVPVQKYLIDFGFLGYFTSNELNVLKKSITDIEVWDRLANMFVHDKEYRKAIEIYHHILDLDPDHFDTLCQLGYLYYSIQEYSTSLNHFFQAIETYTDIYDDEYIMIGEIYRELGQDERAKKYFRYVASHRHSCGREHALFNLADMFIQEGQIHRVKRYLWRIFADDIHNSSVWTEYISIFRKEGDKKRVVAVLKEAFKYNPANYGFLEQLAEVYKDMLRPIHFLAAKLRIKLRKRKIKGMKYIESDHIDNGRIKITFSRDGKEYYPLSIVKPVYTKQLLLQ